MLPYRRALLAAVICLLAWPTAFAVAQEAMIPAPAAAPSATAPRYREGEVIVRFRPGVEEGSLLRALNDVGAERVRAARLRHTYLVQLEPGASVESAIGELGSRPDVEYAEPNGIVRKHAGTVVTPNDEFFFRQWNLKMVSAERTWALQAGQPTVGVAILDTGIAYETYDRYRKAPDFENTTFLPGWDFVNNDSHPNDDDYHGTHVASTVAEATNNGIGLAGLAYRCALMPVKVLDASGDGSYFDVAQGIDYAANFTQDGHHPVRVINMSFGGAGSSETMRRAVDAARAQGVILVASSGNDGRSGVEFPARLDNVIAVGALDARKTRASYSNSGPELDFAAPGGDCDRDDDADGKADCVYQQMPLPTAVAAGNYATFCYCGLDGTSMATPHVAAAAALLFSAGIDDAESVIAALQDTALHLGSGSGRNDDYGHGLIQPAEALSGLGLNLPKK